MPQLLSRKQAKQQGKNRYFTGTPCCRGHIAPRVTSSALCVECIIVHDHRAYKKRVDHHKLLVSTRTRALEQENPGFQAKRMVCWRKNNRSLWLADRLYQTAKRRQRMVHWADERKMKEVYLQAAQLTISTGIKHHVHHIVPLLEFSDFVCGLHCENNLTILTEEEHQRMHAQLRQVR